MSAVDSFSFISLLNSATELVPDQLLVTDKTREVGGGIEKIAPSIGLLKTVNLTSNVTLRVKYQFASMIDR